jgi:hypothetical protein
MSITKQVSKRFLVPRAPWKLSKDKELVTEAKIIAEDIAVPN